MTEVDTSSYRLPVTKTPIETVGQLQGLESGALTIDKQKLDQANQAFGYMTQALNSLGPNATREDLVKVGQNMVDMKLVPPQMLDSFVREIPADPSQMPAFIDRLRTQTATHQEAVNYYHGQPGVVDTGAAHQPVQTSPRFGMRTSGAPIAHQIPPTTPVIDKDDRPGLYGAQPPVAPPGSVVAPPAVGPGLPVVPRKPDVVVGPQAQPKDQSRLPVAPVTGPVPGPPTGFAPGEAEAATAASVASGTALGKARDRASAFQREIFPLAQAIPGLEVLGQSGTGPGTDTINQLKSFILSNVPGVTEDSFKGLDTVKTYDKVQKYLTDFVNQTGSSGTNDKLAAAFAGNPSTKISNAAAVDVAKAALALRRMEQAQYQEFERSGEKPHKFSAWVAKRNNELDPRAFGVDMMNDEAKKKLLEQIKKNPKEAERFRASLKLAEEFGFIKPQ